MASKLKKERKKKQTKILYVRHERKHDGVTAKYLAVVFT